MNRSMRPFLSLVFAFTVLLCLLLPAPALAAVDDTFPVANLGGDITYQVTEDGPAYTVKVSYCDTSYSGDVVIPATVSNAGQVYSVTGIGVNAFSDCTNLTNVTIPGSVQSIEGYAFYGCTGLTSVSIPGSVESIGYGAFEGCTYLQSVTIPGSMRSIGERAFQDCTGLISVTIPASVTSMGSSAFYDCAGLTSVTFLGAMPPAFLPEIWLDGTKYPNDAFHGCPAGLVFYVPAGSEAAYVQALKETGLVDPIVKAIPNPPAGADYTHGLYPMLSGDGAAWSGSGTLQFISAGPFSGFQWASVDGVVLPASAYTVTEGSTVLALQPAYLATLSAGTHKLTMQFSGGYSEASFTTGAVLVGPPKTGEQAQPWAVLALGVLALAGAWGYLARRKAK